MTQEEWDRASPEKKVLHQFLAAMADSNLSGKRMREAILELVDGMPPELREKDSCMVDSHSSRICEKGVPGCTTAHVAVNLRISESPT